MGAWSDQKATASLWCPCTDTTADNTLVNNNGADGTLTGGASDTMSVVLPSDWEARALKFNGSNQYGSVGRSTPTLTHATISMLVRRDAALNQYDGLAVSRSGPVSGIQLLGASVADHVTYNWSGSSNEFNSAGAQLPGGTTDFNRVLLVVQPTRADLYVNDMETPAFSNVRAHPAVTQPGVVAIATDPFSPAGRAAPITVSDVTIYDRALSRAEREVELAGPQATTGRRLRIRQLLGA